MYQSCLLDVRQVILLDTLHRLVHQLMLLWDYDASPAAHIKVGTCYKSVTYVFTPNSYN
jgi:hypothetical protein